MAVAVNDLFRVSIVGECFSQRIMLTHAYALSTVTGAHTESAASLALGGALIVGGTADLISPYAALLPPQYAFLYIRVQKVAPVRFRYEVTNVAGNGTHASNTDASNQAAALEFHTALAGRDQIGVKHIGPIPQDAAVQDAGELAAAYKTLMQTLATNMKLAPSAVGGNLVWTPVIAHKDPVGSFTIITNNIVQESIRVQRRRTLRVGE